MKRRRFLVQTAGAGLGASLLLRPQRAFAKTFRWKMTTAWPPKLPILQEGCERFAKLVDEASGGRLQIHVYAGGELVPALGVFDAVSQGVMELGVSSPYYWSGKAPAAQFFGSVPFGMTAQSFNAWLTIGDGHKLWQEVYAPFNLYPLPFGNTSIQMGGWFKKELKSVADLQGLKMRIPGLGGKVMAEAGVNVVLMAGGEIYTALERGTLDATEWTGPFHDERLGLYRAAKYYYYPGWQEPGSNLELMINKGAWDTLPKDLKAIVEHAASEVRQWLLLASEAANGPALQRMVSEHGVQLRAFPDDVLRLLRRKSEIVLKQLAAEDPLTRKIYSSYQSFREALEPWLAVGEEAYMHALKITEKQITEE